MTLTNSEIKETLDLIAGVEFKYTPEGFLPNKIDFELADVHASIKRVLNPISKDYRENMPKFEGEELTGLASLKKEVDIPQIPKDLLRVAMNREENVISSQVYFRLSELGLIG